VTLTWSSSGDVAVIWELDADGRLKMPSHPVPLSGTLVLTPDAGLRNWTGFHLFTCRENSDECVQAVVGVSIHCPGVWFFASPPADCPRPARQATMAAQPFERGWMMWLQASGEAYPFHDILVLYEEGGTPHWATYRDTWSPGVPESDPQLEAPSGLLQPVRGFGKLWREKVEVRERLGWAKEPESPIGEGALQCDATRYGRCFVTSPNAGIIVLQPNASGWFAWQGPTPTP